MFEQFELRPSHRPEDVQLVPTHDFAQDLVFANLGLRLGSDDIEDLSIEHNSAVLEAFSGGAAIPGEVYDEQLRRMVHVWPGSGHNLRVLSYPTNMSDFTAAVWVKVLGTAYERNYQWWIGNGSYFYRMLNGESAGGPTTWQGSWLLPSEGATAIVSDSNLTPDQWYHLCLRRTGALMELFVDGQVQADTHTTIHTGGLTSIDNVTWGRQRGSASHDFGGQATDQMLWTRSLPDGAISELGDFRNVMLSGLIRRHTLEWLPPSSAAEAASGLLVGPSCLVS